ncbi:MAG: thiopeptide-type bacteriocin biosynthesis protein [Alphaproteobacteria bacterium]|nr:thiopeptide-type bacteriocin biosynthesis protein [Alphaproteobacteria bacterium]MBV9370820.1 thiopeptide-type bacteriocin biosynthesis protein [Alphaproteobacteria bacterium]MBV9900100.1 thiopeptide-type bacteriocin biosynthesis protein [Alphaproteobacteria bacterium]
MTDVPPWICWHLFYHSNQDAILAEAVKPLVDELDAGGHLSGFFFLRYWDGGPHLRLRFRPAAAAFAPALVERVESALRAGVRETPSTAPIDAVTYARMAGHLGRAEGVEAESLRPDNLLERRDYVPETGKYGEGAGMACAERIFSASSRAALDSLVRRPDRRGAIGAGLLAMLSGLSALGHDAASAKAFLARYAGFWGEHAKTVQGEAVRHGAVTAAPALAEVAQAILGGGRIPGPLAGWARALSGAREALGLRPGVEPDARRDFLATNYFHTHNNRLGLLTLDEAYLGRLADASLARREAA